MPNIPFLNCPSCGKSISDDDLTCPHCGLDLDAPLEATELQALAQPHLDKARKALENGFNLSGALSNCDAAIEYVPESADAHNLRGLILDALDREADAILAYREAVRLDPNLAEARENLDDAEGEHPHVEEFLVEQRTHQPGLRGLNILVTVLGVGIALAVIIGLTMVAYTFGRSLLTPKKQVIFEPNYALVKTVSHDDLQKTAEILKQRWAALGYSNLSFTVSDKDQIIGEIPADANSALINRTKAFGLVEFVDVEQTQMFAGNSINTDFSSEYFPPNNDKKWHTIMTNREIKTALVQGNNGGYEIAFTLTEKGTKILADFTTKNVGKILAIVMDKVVISAPTINGAITAGQGVITGTFTKEEADELTAQIRSEPLPVPLK